MLPRKTQPDDLVQNAHKPVERNTTRANINNILLTMPIIIADNQVVGTGAGFDV
jgi:hypothetical protein